jgi:DNA-binding MarR family transcriptional regulator
MANLESGSKYSPTPLHYLMFVLQHISDETLGKEAGTSLSHVRIMAALHIATTHSQRAIAVHLHQTEANVSRQLQVMQKAGLVNIKKNKKDARQRDVMLTPKGKKKLTQAEKILNHQHKQLLSRLPKNTSKSFDSSVKDLLRGL